MTKTYTVSDLNFVPAIRITGKWLKENGFDVGDKIRLVSDNGILVLMKMTEEEISINEKIERLKK